MGCGRSPLTLERNDRVSRAARAREADAKTGVNRLARASLIAFLGGCLAGAHPSAVAEQHQAASHRALASAPLPPSQTLGELFSDVALSGLFRDGKAWADAVPRRAPEELLAQYRQSAPMSDEALRAFISANFAPPGAANTHAPTPGLALKQHIAELWPILTRSTARVPEHSSLLALPEAYVVPGGRFNEIYYWDSYFTMLGLEDEPALRRGMVDNFAHLIRTYGHIPNGNRSYYLSRSQPPFFFKMVELTDSANPARAFAAYLPALKAEYAYWMNGADGLERGSAKAHVVRMPDGSVLNRYWDARSTPRDESYAVDVETAHISGRDLPQVYRDLRAGAESGWDFSSRWFADGRTLSTVQTSAIVPIDLNSLLYGLEGAIADGCGEAGDRVCVREFSARAGARRAAIHRFLWNSDTGMFDDYHWRERRLVGNVSAAALYPLFFGLATFDQARSTAKAAERDLLRPGGLDTTNRATGQQWDSPNGWAPLQWIAVVGLRRYGEARLAHTIAHRWLATVSRVYAETGKLLEKYDVVTQRPGGGGEYPLQDGFGWTNGVTLGLWELYPEAVRTESLEEAH